MSLYDTDHGLVWCSIYEKGKEQVELCYHVSPNQQKGWTADPVKLTKWLNSPQSTFKRYTTVDSSKKKLKTHHALEMKCTWC